MAVGRVLAAGHEDRERPTLRSRDYLRQDHVIMLGTTSTNEVEKQRQRRRRQHPLSHPLVFSCNIMRVSLQMVYLL